MSSRLSRFLLLWTICAGCTDTGLPDEWDLDRLRLLAVRATPAEAAPGEQVSLEALTYAPRGHEAGLVWTLCRALIDCPSTEFRDKASALITEGATDPATGLFGLQPGVDPIYRVPPETLDGVDEGQRQEGIELTFGLLGVDLDAPNQSEEWARKGLSVSENPAPNLNPNVDAIEVDGVTYGPGDTIEVDAEAGFELEVVPADDAEEAYVYLNSDGVQEDRTEELSTSWYTDVGSLGGGGGSGGGVGPRGPGSGDEDIEGDWITPSSASEGILVVVVRDGRGGTGWLVLDVVVR